MQEFKISKEIRALAIDKIKNNLLKYSYDNRVVKKLLNSNPTKEELEQSSSYSSLKGEIYENIIYEHLVRYAQNNEKIKKFILKGPYQNKDSQYNKSGLLIDKSSQIVYKSAYKDISEFDALFFTDDSVYFVEMTTSKKTSNLNKRLLKKFALLKMIFPNLIIKALIVLTKGSVGIKSFPEYATIWLTNDLENEEFVREIAYKKNVNKHEKILIPPKDKKFIEACEVKYEKFQYFPTLKWILMKSRSNPRFIVDLKFFSSKRIEMYFDIYSKLYIGFLTTEEFKKICNNFNEKVKNDKVIVTIEKINKTDFDIVYYIKLKTGKLFRYSINKNGLFSIKEKEPDGFTNAEVRFFMIVMEDEYYLKTVNIKHILKNLTLLKN